MGYGAIFIAIGVCAGAMVFYRWFHRVPERETPGDPGVIVSPADGVIWEIVRLDHGDILKVPKRFLGRIETWCGEVSNPGFLVSIFMSPLDAHVNWSPVSGKIKSARHEAGTFAMANSWKSVFNEKNELFISAEEPGINPFEVKVIQIAGFVARRIDCWVKEGESLSKGQRIGMIRLGSQVSLILPKNAELAVRKGEKVMGAQTVIARMKPSAEP